MVISIKNTIDVLLKENTDNLQKVSVFLKSNPSVANTYFAIGNLQHGTSQDVDDFINLNLNFIKEGAKDFKIGNTSLVKADLTGIDESIEYLCLNERTPLNIAEYQGHYKALKEEIQRRTQVSSMSVENILEKADTDEKRAVLNELALSESKEGYLENMKVKTIDALQERIMLEENAEDKVKLYELRDRVSGIAFDEITFVNEAVRLFEVQKTLIGE